MYIVLLKVNFLHLQRANMFAWPVDIISELLTPSYLLKISSVGSFPYKNPVSVLPRRYFSGRQCSADESREQRSLHSSESEGANMR